MHFIYKITSFPEDTSGYNLTAYTEGMLHIHLGADVFVEAADILLIEFAVVLHKWLLAMEIEVTDLYYSSMDFEEEPIFALKADQNCDGLIPSSTWSQFEATSVSQSIAKTAARSYLERMRTELSSKYQVDLDQHLEAAVADDRIRKV